MTKKKLSPKMQAVFRAKRRAKWHNRPDHNRSHGPVTVRRVGEDAPEAPPRTQMSIRRPRA